MTKQGARLSVHGISGRSFSYSHSMNVTELKAGEVGIVTGIEADEKAVRRLAMLNVFVGAQVILVRRAPLGGGVMLEAGGVRLALSKKLAAGIRIEKECAYGQKNA